MIFTGSLTNSQNILPAEGTSYVSSLAKELLTSDPAEVFQNQYLIQRYSTEDFNRFLDVIQPDKMNRILMHKGAKTTTKGKLFEMEYSAEPIPDQQIKYILSQLSSKSHPRYSYPARNPGFVNLQRQPSNCKW